MTVFAVTRPRRVLITGAAGGLGAAVARRYVADGAQVALTDINADALGALADELGGVALPGDGTDAEAIKSVAEQAISQLGGLDAVIAAQGANLHSTAHPKTAKNWFKALDINLNGAFLLASHVLPALVESAGSMVLVSSSAGALTGPPGTAGYTAAKAGLIGLMRWLARDYGPQGVRVNAVVPGWIRTPLSEGGMAYLAERDGMTMDEAYAAATAHVPLRRAADPAEIAAVCAFLTSSDASIVTGATVVADGGGMVMDSATTIFDES